MKAFFSSLRLVLSAALVVLSLGAAAQPADSVHAAAIALPLADFGARAEAPAVAPDSLLPAAAAPTLLEDSLLPAPKLLLPLPTTVVAKPAAFVPDPQRALWLSLVLPGAGQIYNRKFWKLPIIYGGFLGCTYAFLWNQKTYMDYSQAYLDIMDTNPATSSYMNFFPKGYDISGREERFKTIFKNRKDRYRRYRDLSAICFIGVYLLSVVDAYVDAQLSVFDISPDLSLRFAPTAIEQPQAFGALPAFGLGATLSF